MSKTEHTYIAVRDVLESTPDGNSVRSTETRVIRVSGLPETEPANQYIHRGDWRLPKTGDGATHD